MVTRRRKPKIKLNEDGKPLITCSGSNKGANPTLTERFNGSAWCPFCGSYFPFDVKKEKILIPEHFGKFVEETKTWWFFNDKNDQLED